MEAGRPSRTAERAAMRRAAHQLLDEPRVFDDPLALAILGRAREAELRGDLASYQTPELRALRAILVARSRFAEDALAESLGRGVSQYVVLGAGLDTFAYRSAGAAAHLRVFEVDHPATQAWKRARLAEVAIAVPPSVVFAPVDFERETLADGLDRAGFDRGKAAFFSWLGVTPYLTRDAIFATLRFVASLPAGTVIVFDFPADPASLGAEARRAFERLAARVASAGEPFVSTFDPAVLASDLRAIGFCEADVQGPDELNARYFSGRADGLRVGGASRMMRASV